MYRICEVDDEDDDVAATLSNLHLLTFFKSAPRPAFDWRTWWLAFHEGAAVAFVGVVPRTYAEKAGCFCRVDLLQEHRGRALQLPDAGC